MQLQGYKVTTIFSKRLPISTVATAFKAMCKYCGTVSNPKTLLKALHYPLFIYTSKSTALFEGSQATPACPSDKISFKTKCVCSNSGMTLKGENTYRSTRRETCPFASFCPPQISDE